MTAMPERCGGPETLLRQRLPATEAAVAAVLARLRSAMAGAAIPAEATGDILLVLAEILNNVVEHSLCGIAGAQIHLEVVRDTDRVLVETVDRGRPLPPKLLSSAELPAMSHDPEDIASLPEGGFGWFIIHALAQDMVYERDGGANHLSFHFAV